MSCCGNKSKNEPNLPIPVITNEVIYNDFLNLFERLKQNPSITEPTARQIHSIFCELYAIESSFNSVSASIALQNLHNLYANRDNIQRIFGGVPKFGTPPNEITFLKDENTYKYALKEGKYFKIDGVFTFQFKKFLTIEEAEVLRSKPDIETIL